MEPAKTQLGSPASATKGESGVSADPEPGLAFTWRKPGAVPPTSRGRDPRRDLNQSKSQDFIRALLLWRRCHQALTGTCSGVAPAYCWSNATGLLVFLLATLPPTLLHALAFPEPQKIEMERSVRSLSPALIGCKAATAGHHRFWPASSYMDDSTSRASVTGLGE